MTLEHQKQSQDCIRRLGHNEKRQDNDFLKCAPNSEGFLFQAHDEKNHNYNFSKHAPKLGGHQDGFETPEMTTA